MQKIVQLVPNIFLKKELSPTFTSILIIDDAALVLTRMQQILQELSFITTVHTAISYTTAIECIELHKPHIILLDIMLGEKNGIDILLFVKQHYPLTKVIIVSNKATSYYRRLFCDNGADAFVDKSKEFETLPEIIKACL